MVPSVGIAPTFQALQARANLSQLTWLGVADWTRTSIKEFCRLLHNFSATATNMVATVGLEPTINSV